MSKCTLFTIDNPDTRVVDKPLLILQADSFSSALFQTYRAKHNHANVSDDFYLTEVYTIIS